MYRHPDLLLIFLFRVSVSSIVFFSLVSCDGQSGNSFLPDPPGYNSKNKRVILLHKQLLEVSGIAYLPDGVIAAVNDEAGKIFMVDSGEGKPRSISFGPKGDYEDIVYHSGVFYVLESNGSIHVVPHDQPALARRIRFPVKGKTEFESLYFDLSTRKLMLLSKEQRKVREAIIVYCFDPLTEQFSESPDYTITLKEIRELMKDYSAECKPSGAAVHPLSGKLYVIASVGKLMFVSSTRGKVEQVYSLNPDLFSQPEGITFSPAGDMYISNEGVQGKATLVQFRYKVN